MISGKTIHKSEMHMVAAGGGTGGHLFPGIAVAREMKRRNLENRILFIGTDKPFERNTLEKYGLPHRAVYAEGMKGRGIMGGIRAMIKIPLGVIQSLWIIFRFKPDIIMGLGGYASAPVVMAGWMTGKKIVLHEQNRRPGITNRMLSKIANRIYLSFKATDLVAKPGKLLYTGNPVRSEILQTRLAAQKEISGNDAGKLFHILILGGSQGAHRINMAIIEALGYIQKKDCFRFSHQTGRKDEDTAREAYRKRQVSGDVRSFFSEMAEQYRKADLVICRAGATTVAEITAVGKAAIFIPFPYAADDHQVKNAEPLVNAGAAEMILEKDLTGEMISRRIEYYADHPEAITEMALKAREFGCPDASERIVDDMYRLAGIAAGS